VKTFTTAGFNVSATEANARERVSTSGSAVSRAGAFGASAEGGLAILDEGAGDEGATGASRWVCCQPEVVGPTARTSAAKSAAMPAARASGRKGRERFEFMLMGFLSNAVFSPPEKQEKQPHYSKARGRVRE
jgi:hypothetical protein